jgi:hypothetical protein
MYVEQDERVVAFGGEVLPLDAVAGDIDHVTVLFEPLFQVIAQFGLVFDDKNSHRRMVQKHFRYGDYDLVILLTDKALALASYIAPGLRRPQGL